jgi:hypothetical protein
MEMQEISLEKRVVVVREKSQCKKGFEKQGGTLEESLTGL